MSNSNDTFPLTGRELLSVGSLLPSSKTEVKQALSELSQLNRTVESLKDDPEKCGYVVDETDIWKCIERYRLVTASIKF